MHSYRHIGESNAQHSVVALFCCWCDTLSGLLWLLCTAMMRFREPYSSLIEHLLPCASSAATAGCRVLDLLCC